MKKENMMGGQDSEAEVLNSVFATGIMYCPLGLFQ